MRTEIYFSFATVTSNHGVIFTMTEKAYQASCGCNNIRYCFNTAVLPGVWPVRKCTCSFCSRRTNHVHCADPNGSVSYEFSHPEKVTRYRHGTKTADFLVCTSCDSYMGAVMLTDKGRFAVLNIEHLVDDLLLPEINNLVWESEDLESRLARRHKTWTPVIGAA